MKLFGNFEEARSGSVDAAKVTTKGIYKRDPKYIFNNTIQGNRRFTQMLEGEKTDLNEYNNIEIVHSARSTIGNRKGSIRQEPKFSHYFVNMLRP